jgi:hypothetical protein
MGVQTYLANAWLDDLFGKAPFTPPAHIYLGLSLTDPLADGSGLDEPAGGSYERVETDAADWTAASARAIENAVAVAFATPSGNWGDVAYAFLADAISGGHLLVSGALPAPVEVTDGSSAPTFEAGSLPFTLPWE